jgi:ABC-2 type transport system ATP-binding protein
MPNALELRDLTKRYDDGTLALDALDLDVPSGRFFGLLGPNGAGKTTLISAVCNLIRLTEGEIAVFGHPGGSMEARRLIGVAEQEPNLDRFLTVFETLVYHGGYYGMAGTAAAQRAEEMIDVFDLRAKRDVRAPKLSGGMRRRLLLARALLHEPRLVILDEPTAGVDLELRHELWRYIRRLHEPAHHSLPRGGRGTLRGDRPDRRRADHGPGYSRRPQRALRRRHPRGCLHEDRCRGSPGG